MASTYTPNKYQMVWSRYQSAVAWSKGQSYSNGNVSTNGRDIFSYAHVIGITTDDGEKVAYDCHYSPTTSKHCSSVKVMADRVEKCPKHS